MSRRLSLRARLVMGSLVWTLVLMTILGYLTLLMRAHELHVTPLLHFSLVAFLCLLGIAAGVVQLALGLSPFNDLRKHLADVRDGRERTVTGDYPGEVQPLVDDLNALLDQREQAVRRAVAKAGDLAHGLKTPLAVIAQEASRAAAAGHADLAASLNQQIERMRRQIDYHLAHARAAASGATLNARALVRESVDGLVRTLHRLHADRGLSIEATIPQDLAVRAQREDLDEMLGNLLDNACKWARRRVVAVAARDGAAVVIVVDDDGPGLAAEMRETVLQRGVRADEAAPGSGLGLAIVRDLAELYGGSIALSRSPLGGLRAALTLPPA
jgi:signal transduction histidine kinase